MESTPKFITAYYHSKPEKFPLAEQILEFDVPCLNLFYREQISVLIKKFALCKGTDTFIDIQLLRAGGEEINFSYDHVWMHCNNFYFNLQLNKVKRAYQNLIFNHFASNENQFKYKIKIYSKSKDLTLRERACYVVIKTRMEEFMELPHHFVEILANDFAYFWPDVE